MAIDYHASDRAEYARLTADIEVYEARYGMNSNHLRRLARDDWDTLTADELAWYYTLRLRETLGT